jgi:uncharacterized membrane protein (DUF106 family)
MIEKLALKLIHWIGSTNSVITHTILFILAFLSYFLGFDLTKILLIITTIVSLEAIYLSIFIQMSVNLQTQKLHSLQKDVQEIQEDVEDIQEDIQEDSEKE